MINFLKQFKEGSDDLNEGIRDKMIPKSEEDIDNAMDIAVEKMINLLQNENDKLEYEITKIFSKCQNVDYCFDNNNENLPIKV
jgi:hypothetical protein